MSDDREQGTAGVGTKRVYATHLDAPQTWDLRDVFVLRRLLPGLLRPTALHIDVGTGILLRPLIPWGPTLPYSDGGSFQQSL